MSIADEIEKQYSQNMLSARATARRTLIANAADDKKRIESARPRKQKNSKSIVEEAHPDEVFVMEADGLGGMVGSLEQVHDQIMNALNRRPSAFPYQGLVANAVLDFKKTAEILESHSLHAEADAVLRLAGDLLTVLERQGKINKVAVSGGDPSSEEAARKVLDDFFKDIKTPPPLDANPQSISTAPPAETGPATEPVPPKATTEPATAPPQAAPEQPAPRSSSTATASEIEQLATKTAPKAAAERTWLSTLKGFSGKALGGVLKILPVALLASSLKHGIEDLGKGDVSTLLMLLAGGTVGAFFAPEVALGAIATAAMNGALAADILGSIVKFGFGVLKRDGFADKLKALREHLSNKLESAAPIEKAPIAKMLEQIDGAIKTVPDLESAASKSEKDVNVSQVASYLFDIAQHVAEARKIYDNGSISDSETGSLLKEVEDSLNTFGAAVASKYESNKLKIQEANSNLKAQPDLAKETIDAIHAAQSRGEAFTPRQDLAPGVGRPDQIVETAVSDPEEIKRIQSKIGAPVTGNWDAASVAALNKIRDNWLGFDVKLKDVVTVDALKAAGSSVIDKINKLWNDRYTEAMP